MSTQFGLPSELKQLEAKLRQQEPQGCAVNRDALMYQAGWAAAEVAGKLRWGWPATTGVLAASVAILAFMLMSSDEKVPLVVQQVEQVEAEVEPIVTPLVVEPEQVPRVVPTSRWEGRFSALASRHRLQEWNSPVAENSAVTLSEVKSVRALMKEFLEETKWVEPSRNKVQKNQRI